MILDFSYDVLFNFPSGANLGITMAILAILASLGHMWRGAAQYDRPATGILVAGLVLGVGSFLTKITERQFDSHIAEGPNAPSLPHTPGVVFFMLLGLMAVALVFVTGFVRERRWTAALLCGVIAFSAGAAFAQAGYLRYYTSDYLLVNTICWLATGASIIGFAIAAVRYYRWKKDSDQFSIRAMNA